MTKPLKQPANNQMNALSVPAADNTAAAAPDEPAANLAEANAAVVAPQKEDLETTKSVDANERLPKRRTDRLADFRGRTR